VVFGEEEFFGGVEEGLGGDAADAEAGAAEAVFFVDAGGFEAELGGADGGDVSAGASADDDEVVAAGGGADGSC
jgi:hypothetical protein